MKTDFNYHTHTALCGHAEGTMEEYIKSAIEGGIKSMGFSDHAPYVFPDGHESHFRVPSKKAKQYAEDLKEAERIIKEYSLNYIGKPHIIFVNK